MKIDLKSTLKNFSYFFIFLMPFSLFAQQLDESFLESLPEELRENLKQEIELRNESEEIQFRRPSTFIQKPADESERFGLNFFSMMQSTMMPLNEPNFDTNFPLRD